MDKGLTIYPTSVYALEGKGLVLYELGHYEALVSLDKALELDPSAYDALNDKGLTHETGRLHASTFCVQYSHRRKSIRLRGLLQ